FFNALAIAPRHAHSARKKTFFGHVGFRSLCSLGVRPKNLSASRFACKFFSLPLEGKGDRRRKPLVDEV
ncbi:MAG: hypothetical protein II155_00160, partial [Clostridia bacterium]|nr:hypothetical protein [Clostridia bacterium]